MKRTIIVGVDFGTSTTKVFWQDLRENRYEAFSWDRRPPGIESLLLPSSITMRGDSLLFGLADADSQPGDLCFRMLKLCVLCRGKPGICRCGSPGAKDGFVHLPGASEAIPARAFACLFLAFVLRTVEGELYERFPNDDLLLVWNIGCPMDHLDEENRRSEWERMAAAAFELRSEVAGPVNRSMLDDALQRMEICVVPPESEREFFIVPEGLAAIKAFLESPYAEWKTYAVVDVGAGTTEVSFFSYRKAMKEPGQPFRPEYLADSTASIGGRAIDHELAGVLHCTVEDAQRRKEAGLQDGGDLQAIAEIAFQYARTCADIVRGKKLIAKGDQIFDLFIIGGCGRLPALKRQLKSKELPGHFHLDSMLRLRPPPGLRNGSALAANFDLLAIACGLASSLDWEYYPPKETKPMSPPPVKQPKDVDELYPK